MRVLLFNSPGSEHSHRLTLNCERLPRAEPLQLGYLAAVLERQGHKVRITDLNYIKHLKTTAQQALLDFVPDLVGISSTTASYPMAANIAKLSKQLVPTATVVVGGCHVTFTAEATLQQSPDVDIVVRGEGEITLPELVACVETGTKLDHVLGISYREDGHLVHNPPRPFIQDLDSLSWPARHLFDMTSYMDARPLFTSRGCPGHCIFCSAAAMSGSRYRLRRPERVVDEIEYLGKTYNTRNFVILDDTFTAVPKKLTLPVCEEICRRGMKINFSCESRVDVATPELLKALYTAGCRMIQFGVESGSPRVLAKLRKRINLDQVRSAVRVGVDLGISLVCTFILGHPFEEEEDAHLTVNLMKELRAMGVKQTPLSFLTPFPGTDIYERREEYGVTLHETDWGRFTFDSPIISTRYLSRDQLRGLVLDTYTQLSSALQTGVQVD